MVDTDHWEQLLLCGTDTATCQSLDTPDTSRGLLGTLLDGTNRMVGAIDPATQKTAARALIRLVINKKTEKLALFMEPIYPLTCPAALSSSLLEFAKERARALQLPLFSIATDDSTYLADKATPTKDILIYKGSDLWQYTDKGAGLIKGPFNIKNVVLINSDQ